MERTAPLVLLCLAAFLVLSPLVLEKPGWPAGLKADEPAYYLMALSLARDGDLRCDLGDLRRLFDEFPYQPVDNLILATDDGWNTIYFGKPYLFSLFAAPAAALFGASGVVAFNFALLAAMIGLGFRYLRRFNTDAVALLFAAGFFLLSGGFIYVFWLHPEVFNMAAVTASLYLGLAEPGRRRAGGRWRRLVADPRMRAWGSGAFLVLAAYNKPMLALLGLPALFVLARRKHLKALVAWGLGFAVCLGLVVGLAMAWTGHPSAYLGMTRGGKRVCSPHEMPFAPTMAPLPTADGAEPAEEAVRGSWTWMFRLPRFHPTEVAESLGYFLWGRHAGLFLYFPFSLLAAILFLLHGRRSGRRWAVFAALAAVALVFLLWIPANWQGGGGFVGNRYFVNAYPGFLFLVTRVAPRWIHLLGYALGGMLLGPTMLTPMGRAIPWPTLQAHVRNFPYPLFPLELSLREVPGYAKHDFAGIGFRGRKDVFLPRGGSFWVHGATTTELWIQSLEPLDPLRFQVRSLGLPNEVVLRSGGAEARLVFEPGESGPRPVELSPGPTRVRSVYGTTVYAYRLEVRAATGEVRPWTKRFPPLDCEYFPDNPTLEEAFYVGAELTYLGTPERLERDLYAVEWGECRAPTRVSAGEVFTVDTVVRNASVASWPVDPPTRVGLSYRWEDATGEVVVESGRRTHLDQVVEPGERVAVAQEVEAPAEPGSYLLVLDPVFELVAWFSWKNGGDVYRIPVEVTAGIPLGVPGGEADGEAPEPLTPAPSPTRSRPTGRGAPPPVQDRPEVTSPPSPGRVGAGGRGGSGG